MGPFGSASDHASAVRGLLQAPGWTRDRLRVYQGERLRRIALHAARNIPFYQKSFRSAGVDPERIRHAGDIARLPIIGKADAQADPAAFLPRGVVRDDLCWMTTSGSTGQPMYVCRTLFEERLMQAFRVRAEFSLGMRLRDRRAVLSFAGNPRRPVRASPLERLRILSRTTMDITRPPGEIIQTLRTLQPHVIASYPGALSLIAQQLTDADRALIRPRFIALGAEALRPQARKTIADGFQTEVYDFYGAHECNLVGFECAEHKGIHLNEANLIVEILRDGKPAQPGEEGEVVITTLHSYAMPFLRYRLGDSAVRGADCSCGRPFAMAASIQGRTVERAYRADGQSVTALAVAHIFVRASWIEQFQMVQYEAGKLHVYLVTAQPASPENVADLIRDAEQKFQLALSVELVPQVPIRPSGKMPIFVSRVGGQAV